MQYIWAFVAFFISNQALGTSQEGEAQNNNKQVTLADADFKDIRGKVYSYLDNQSYKSISEVCKSIRLELMAQPGRFLFKFTSDKLPENLLPVSGLDLSEKNLNWCIEQIPALLNKLPKIEKIRIKVIGLSQYKDSFHLDIVPIEGVSLLKMAEAIVSFMIILDPYRMGTIEEALSRKADNEKLYLLYLLGYIYPQTIIKYKPQDLVDTLANMEAEKRKQFSDKTKDELFVLWTGRRALEIMNCTRIEV